MHTPSPPADHRHEPHLPPSLLPKTPSAQCVPQALQPSWASLSCNSLVEQHMLRLRVALWASKTKPHWRIRIVHFSCYCSLFQPFHFLPFVFQPLIRWHKLFGVQEIPVLLLDQKVDFHGIWRKERTFSRRSLCVERSQSQQSPLDPTS